jgi:hypothetical protein
MTLRIVAVVVLLAACKGKDKAPEPSAGSATSSTPTPSTTGSATAGSAATGSAAAGSATAGSATGSATAGSAAAGSAAGSAATATTYCGAAPCPCKAGSEQKSGDKLSICELEKAVKIGAYECGPGRLVFHDDGALEECLLAADTTVGDYACKSAPLSTAFHKDGKLRNCSLAKDATIGDFTITTGRGIRLHPDGKLRNGWTEKVVTIDGWACTKETYLFASGKLETCVVDVAGKVGTQAIPPKSTIRLTEDGKLRGLELGAAGVVAGKPAKANDRFCFEDGKPEKSQTCWMY